MRGRCCSIGVTGKGRRHSSHSTREGRERRLSAKCSKTQVKVRPQRISHGAGPHATRGVAPPCIPAGAGDRSRAMQLSSTLKREQKACRLGAESNEHTSATKAAHRNLRGTGPVQG